MVASGSLEPWGLLFLSEICITMERFSGVPRLCEGAGDESLAYLINTETKSAPHQRNKCANPDCLNHGTMQVEI